MKKTVATGGYLGRVFWPTRRLTQGPRPREQPPVLPDKVGEFSRAGIEATIRFEIDAINYAQRTGDLDPLQRVYDTPTCKACKLLVERLSAALVNGSHFVDGEYTVTAIEAAQTSIGSSAERLGNADLSYVQPKEAKLIDKDGKELKKRPPNSYVKIPHSLTFNAGRWVIQDISPGEKR